jgi:peptide/nickel transport system ATP-binding protein
MLELQGVNKVYSSGLLRKQHLQVLEGISLRIERGRFLGLVGESGSGKTTLARVALRLIDATSGNIFLDGMDITSLKKREMRPLRKRIQIVFQHPETALDPQFKLRESIQEALLQTGTPRARLRERMVEACAQVSLPEELLDRYPSQVSGGEIQRAALLRVLAFQPDYLFLDEPTSMLDVSVQAYILNLLQKIADEREMGVVLISHDLDVIKAMCSEVGVLYKGKLVEKGDTAKVLGRPEHEITKGLLAAWNAQNDL